MFNDGECWGNLDELELGLGGNEHVVDRGEGDRANTSRADSRFSDQLSLGTVVKGEVSAGKSNSKNMLLQSTKHWSVKL